MNPLIGRAVPGIALAASDGSWVDLSRMGGTCVVFCYPYTGKPGVPNPPGWDDIPGAHGSTPQALAFAAAHRKFSDGNVTIFGLSLQSREWQADFAVRNALPYQLLSDENHAFCKALELKTFRAGDVDYLHRQTLVVRAGSIVHVVDPVPAPELNAEEVLDFLAR